jgi:hypothetical protein
MPMLKKAARMHARRHAMTSQGPAGAPARRGRGPDIDATAVAARPTLGRLTWVRMTSAWSPEQDDPLYV